MTQPRTSQRRSIIDVILDKRLETSWQPMLSDYESSESGRCRLKNRHIHIHVGLVLIYTICSILVVRVMTPSPQPPTSEKRHFALADITSRFDTVQEYELMSHSSFVGYPSNRSSDAWHDLLRFAHLRVSPTELSQSEPSTTASRTRSSVSLPSGGVLAWLGVMHELHCIKIFYETNYREHFWPGIGDRERRDLQVHADHCIDQLRQAAMCRADLGSLTTFTWRQGYDKPLLSPERPLHQCADWDDFRAQVAPRVVSAKEMSLMESL